MFQSLKINTNALEDDQVFEEKSEENFSKEMVREKIRRPSLNRHRTQ